MEASLKRQRQQLDIALLLIGSTKQAGRRGISSLFLISRYC
jgi:hypothetical protein